MRVATLLATFAAGLLLLGSSASAAPSSAIVRLVDVGSGANEVWIFLPEKTPQCVLTFLHDRADLSPARYTSWLDYTVLNDQCAVVFPRYEVGPGASAAAKVRGLHAGVSTGMTYLLKNSFVVGGEATLRASPAIVAGFGSGAGLAVTYATSASAWGFATPKALDIIFPVVLATAPLPRARLASSMRVLVQLGDRDTTAGRASALAVRRYLGSRSRARTQIHVIHSTPSLPAVHDAPLQVNTASETTFWGALDVLIGSVVT
jgi:acetyl esterase/lipase